MSIVNFKRPKVMLDDTYKAYLDGRSRADSTPTKDCPNLVTRLEKNKKRKVIVAGDDSGSN